MYDFEEEGLGLDDVWVLFDIKLNYDLHAPSIPTCIMIFMLNINLIIGKTFILSKISLAHTFIYADY